MEAEEELGGKFVSTHDEHHDAIEPHVRRVTDTGKVRIVGWGGGTRGMGTVPLKKLRCTIFSLCSQDPWQNMFQLPNPLPKREGNVLLVVCGQVTAKTWLYAMWYKQIKFGCASMNLCKIIAINKRDQLT